MKFLNTLSVNFKGPKSWELSAPLAFEFECDNALVASLNKYKLKKLGQMTAMPIDDKTSLVTLSVPAGFMTDLASIPRPCWAIIAPWDVARAAVIHDLLYKQLRKLKAKGSKINKKMKTSDIHEMREAADLVFLMGMNSAEPAVPQWKIQACHKSVRGFGRFVI